MPPTGHNEADTRAEIIDPALHSAYWVERVADAERSTQGEVQREETAVRRWLLFATAWTNWAVANSS